MQVMFAVLVAIGWLYYFWSTTAGVIALIVLLPATVVAAYKLRRYHEASLAAHNVVAAVATFGGLPLSEQEKVHGHAMEIIHRSGWQGSRPPNLEDDAVRFGWYALAMAELGIRPVCLIGAWRLVRNPLREALNPAYYFQTSLQMAAKQGYAVSLNRAAVS